MRTKTGKTVPALLLAGALVFGLGVLEPIAFAQAPAPSSASGPSTADPGTAVGNNSGGTAPGPNYPGPASASGANSPPVNSGLTDPKTGANNDPLPPKAKISRDGVPAGPYGATSTDTDIATH